MIDYCNGRLLEYSGLAPHEVTGTDWVRLLHPDDAAHDAGLAECVKTGAPYRVEVRTYFAADHTYRWCVTDALPLHDEHGNHSQVVRHSHGHARLATGTGRAAPRRVNWLIWRE